MFFEGNQPEGTASTVIRLGAHANDSDDHQSRIYGQWTSASYRREMATARYITQGNFGAIWGQLLVWDRARQLWLKAGCTSGRSRGQKFS